MFFCIFLFCKFFGDTVTSKNIPLRSCDVTFHSSLTFQSYKGQSWPWSYGNWIYNYLCNQCLLPLMLWVRISIKARCTTLCDKVCQWLWPDRHDLTEILLKMVLSTIKQTKHPIIWQLNLLTSRKSAVGMYSALILKDLLSLSLIVCLKMWPPSGVSLDVSVL